MRNDSVIRAFAIIEYLAEQADWVGIRKLARDLDLGPATASRFLNSLKDLGYVRQHPVDARYQLSLRCTWLASRVLEKVQIRSVARPWMERLVAQTNETVHLAMLEGVEMVYIDKVDSQQPVQMRSRVGARAYVHSTAVGRAVLAFLPPGERDSVIARLHLPRLTEYTITDALLLERSLDLVRRHGYAMDDEENEVGIRCLGAPVFDHLATVQGAISISGWTITMTPERARQLAPILVATAANISRELGYVQGGNRQEELPGER